MTQTKLAKSFLIAAKGTFHEIVEERNIKIQIIIGLCAIILSISLKIPKINFIIILLVSFLVIILELLNTGFEKLIDVISPDYNKDLGRVKDISSAAVLISSILAVIVGLLILYRPIINALKLSYEFALINFMIINTILLAIIIFIFIKRK
jgi:diacylglycerol kinase